MLLLAALTVGATVACRQKPAYSDMQLGPSASNNQNSANQPAPALNANDAGAAARNSNSQAAQFKLPLFIDERTGEIKDLPTYPGAYRSNAQYGPQKGADSAFVALQTGDSIEKVAAFYNNAIKSNGWTVSTTTHEPEFYQIDFKKGDTHQGTVQARKNPQTGYVDIGLSRVEWPPTSGK